MFSLINVGERSGCGLCDIYSTWEENGFIRPRIDELSEPSRVVLTLEVESMSNEARNEARNGVLTVRESEILYMIEDSPSISVVALSEELKTSRSTIDRTIKGLKEKGYLIHEGSTKKGRWKILK